MGPLSGEYRPKAGFSQKMEQKYIRKIALGGVLAAIILLLTTLISIPLPGGHGYINLGDAGVLTAAYMLGGTWGAIVAAAASGLADVLLGWGLYAPATCVIKGGMALLSALLFRALKPQRQSLAFFLPAPIVPIGYFLYEWALFGFAASIVNVPLNFVQCLAGAAVAQAVALVVRKNSISRWF